MAKKATTKIHPQTILKGNVIRTQQKTDEVVRSVSVVVEYANGWVERYEDGDTAQLVAVEAPEFPAELLSETKS